MNDRLAAITARNPDRFQFFAALPTPDPEQAAAELERSVTKLDARGAMIFGRTGRVRAARPFDTVRGAAEQAGAMALGVASAVHADDRRFDALYATAERLGAPLYLHPQQPEPPVKAAYYTGFGEELDAVFASAGLGWYYDNGVELIRLIFSGVFDRHPGLQVIVGHWGELVLFYLDHIGVMQTMGLKLGCPLAEYFRENVWVTGSGLLSESYFRWTAETVGIDRIMYSTDYPYTYATGYTPLDTAKGRARDFLERLEITDEQRKTIASGNWERLGRRLAAGRGANSE